MSDGTASLLVALALSLMTVGCPEPGELDLSEWPEERSVRDGGSSDVVAADVAVADAASADVAFADVGSQDTAVGEPVERDAGASDTSEPPDTATAQDTAEPDTPGPAEQQTWRFEGEGGGVQATTGRANDDAYNLWSNGELSVQVEVPHDGDYIVRVRVWADQCCDELARMAVRFDEQDQSQFDVAATEMSRADVIEHRIDGVRAARHTVGVAFLNDAYDPNAGYDRNLLVDWLEVEGPLP